MPCSNTLAEIERDLPEPWFQDPYDRDPDLAYDEAVSKELEKDIKAISDIIHKHIFSATDLVAALVDFTRKVRRGSD